MTTEYIPGVCNLGPAERVKRIHAGRVGLLLAVIFEAACVYFGWPPAVRALIFFPAFMSAIGFIQAYSNFCVAYGLMGVFNVSMSVGKTDTVSQAEFRALDKKKSRKMIAGAFLIASAVTVLAAIIR